MGTTRNASIVRGRLPRCGVSPIEHSSGRERCRRLNRGGDRQANSAQSVRGQRQYAHARCWPRFGQHRSCFGVVVVKVAGALDAGGGAVAGAGGADGLGAGEGVVVDEWRVGGAFGVGPLLGVVPALGGGVSEGDVVQVEQAPVGGGFRPGVRCSGGCPGWP
ncbi:hypothetical protein ACH4SK_41100 [Streptomyces inhibens]|uniref:hypothetical protein n=1 Tax=Streptomyces inhibens TaxID=2293571 RepID=UPI0037B940B0